MPPTTAAERPGMFFAQSSPSVGVVVENCEFGTPGYPHGETGGEHDAHDCLEAVRPRRRRTQGSRRPVKSRHQFAHLQWLRSRLGLIRIAAFESSEFILNGLSFCVCGVLAAIADHSVRKMDCG